MTINVKIDYTTYIEVTREADPDDPWDCDDTYTSYNFGSTFRKHKYADLFLAEEPEDGDIRYAVYVIYSTGCTFSHDEDGEIEWMALFEEEHQAKELVDKIEKEDYSTLEYTDHTGNTIKRGYIPWDGYFEDFSRAGYVEVRYVK